MTDQPLEDKINFGPEAKEKIEKVMSRLTFREREIIKLRYGLADGYTYTLATVAEKYGITKARVRQIEAKAVKKLLHFIALDKLQKTPRDNTNNYENKSK